MVAHQMIPSLEHHAESVGCLGICKSLAVRNAICACGSVVLGQCEHVQRIIQQSSITR